MKTHSMIFYVFSEGGVRSRDGKSVPTDEKDMSMKTGRELN